ncbi:MAG: M50 family metallopeptidase [Defluviitaleaceae bacterium]|nr:M50 family metallopeptidase [Defluviitaleaceae bacterium]
MDTLIPVLIFILILGVVIFIHELGHFLAARRAGIFVEEFALGMGPILLSYQGRRKGEGTEEDEEGTLYSLRAFPIGGFCRMRGMDDEANDDPGAMNNKPIPARLLVMAGGSIMNFLLAFVLFFMLVMLQGYNVLEVVSVNEGFPAYNAGLRAGDRITHINGTRVDMQEDMAVVINAARGRDIAVRVNRDGVRYDFSVTPDYVDGRYLIGITRRGARQQGFLSDRPTDGDFRRIRVGEGLVNAGEMIVFHIRAPFRLIAQLIAGDPLPEGGAVMGPIGIGAVVTEVYQISMEQERGILDMVLTMVFIAAFINAALGIMNLLPIPALDGARIIFLLIEAVRKKPVPPEKEAMVHMVGFVILIVLAIFIAYQDIARLLNLGDYAG